MRWGETKTDKKYDEWKSNNNKWRGEHEEYKRVDDLGNVKYSVLFFDGGHLALKFESLEVMLLLFCMESLLHMFDVGLLFALPPDTCPHNFWRFCCVFLLFLHALARAIFWNPSSSSDYIYFCSSPFNIFVQYFFEFVCFVGGVIAVGVIGGLLLVFGGWLLLLFYVCYCLWFSEC